jgi:hypothetical protein
MTLMCLFLLEFDLGYIYQVLFTFAKINHYLLCIQCVYLIVFELFKMGYNPYQNYGGIYFNFDDPKNVILQKNTSSSVWSKAIFSLVCLIVVYASVLVSSSMQMSELEYLDSKSSNGMMTKSFKKKAYNQIVTNNDEEEQTN